MRNRNVVKLITNCKKKRVTIKNGGLNRLKSDQMSFVNIIMKLLKNGKLIILNI